VPRVPDRSTALRLAALGVLLVAMLCGALGVAIAWWLADYHVAGPLVASAGLLAAWLLLAIGVLLGYRALRRTLADNDRLTWTDGLTGLANRLALRRSLAEHEGDRRTLLVIDIDRFSDVNDAFGYSVGDELLRLAAARLRAAVPDSALIARVGGDQFGVLLSDDTTGADEHVGDAVEAAVNPLTLPVGESNLEVRASVGLASGVGPGTMLAHRAETAMRAAKRAGTDWARWEPAMEAGATERLELLHGLRAAIGEGQLRLHMQPIRRLAGGRVVGAEALVRWQHPRYGLLMPDAFVPLAERCELIHDLTAWVLDEAVREAAGWAAQGEDMLVAVNLSARNLTPDLPDQVAATVARHGFDPGRLCVELTETALPESMEVAAAVLARLGALGVNVAVDDFGTGFATLSWLRRLPFKALKIDRSFLAGVDSDRAARELVRHIISLAHHLDMAVIGEGVESAAHWSALAEFGCDEAQGYFVARPMPAADFLPWTLADRMRQSAPGVDAVPLVGVA
jgi:diguanylate cyclase (GGDEF)-like protein